MEKITSYSELTEKIKNKEKSYVLLYKKGSEQSECAFGNLGSAEGKDGSSLVFYADVTEVRDIHGRYGITSAPALLVFENGELSTVIKGCHDAGFYGSLLQDALYRVKAQSEGKKPKRVTVYSTPSCSWCNTLKAWLKRNGIPYRDVDVSRDENAARDLVNRTGQQGVPQTDINGQIVVGFNEARLKQLLEI